MRRLVSWLIGFSIGAAVGALIVALLVEEPAKEVQARLREGYEETRREARLASERRRFELEAKFETLRARPLRQG